VTGPLSTTTRAVEGAALLAPVLAIYANKGLSPLMAILGALAIYSLWRADSLRVALGLPGARALMALLAWALFSAIWAINPRDALSTAAGVSAMVIGGAAFVAAARTTGLGDVRRLGIALGWGLGLGIAAGLDYEHGHAVHRMLWALQGVKREWIPTGINTGMTVLVLAAFPGVIVFWRNSWKALALAAPLAVAAVVLPAHAITPRLALVSGFAVFALALWLGRAMIMTMVMAMAASILFTPLLVGTLLRPETHAAWLAGRSLSGLHRLYIWEFVTGHIGGRPFLGWGMDAARSLPGGGNLVLGSVPVLPLHPHNAALQLWVELGAVGAILGAVVVLTIGRAIWRLDDPVARAGAAGAFAAAFVVLSASFGVWQNWWLAALGIVAAITVAACHWPVRRDNAA
jgi:exopolysaccharide production protein ExoQ